MVITVQVIAGTPANYRNWLEQNTPNPSAGSTVIAYTVARASRVAINLFNVGGERVLTLVDRWHAPGRYSVWWDGRDDHGRILPQGLYLYRMDAAGFTKSRKMMIAQ